MDGLKEAAGYVLAVTIGVVAWFTRRDLSRYDQGLERIGKLELTTVTHEQLERYVDRVAVERAAMHSENKEWLRRIEEKIDANELRRSKTDHDQRNALNAVNLRVAVLATKAGVALPGDPAPT